MQINMETRRKFSRKPPTCLRRLCSVFQSKVEPIEIFRDAKASKLWNVHWLSIMNNYYE